MFANGLEKYYKPIDNFGAWGTETVESKREWDSNAKSYVMSTLSLLSMAATFSIGNNMHTIYFDVRDNSPESKPLATDFVDKFIDQMFYYAEKIARLQKYRAGDFGDIAPAGADEDLQSKGGISEEALKKINELANWNEVFIMGFNSNKFDMKLLLQHLEGTKWHIDRKGSMGTRSVKVTRDGSDVVLVFRDTLDYVQSCSLYGFAKDFGNGIPEQEDAPVEERLQILPEGEVHQQL
jgi:hypothetical protein